MYKPPVAFFGFNRPDCTKVVFEEIRRHRPEKLFLVADGPRPTVPTDKSRCEAVRKIMQSVDWDCEVKINFSEENLGCKKRMASGIDWVFSQVEEAILLEDDCVPCPDFFRFCSEMLIRYRDNPKVVHIAGTNYQAGQIRGDGSYYFSRFVHIWGWATWRRAWQNYDVTMRSWPQAREEKWLSKFHATPLEWEFWTDNFNRVHAGEVDTWDYQWGYACWRHDGIGIIPNVNLITNIGAGPDATHTKGPVGSLEVPTGTLGELRHPQKILVDHAADKFTFDEHCGGNELRRQKEELRRQRNIFTRIRRVLGLLLSIPKRDARKIRDQGRKIRGQVPLMLKAISTLLVRTNVRRWSEVAKNPQPHWDDRNENIARLIPPGSSVIDLGCGPQTLRRHLDPSCKYQPCDVIQSTPDVIFCDFNAGVYPEVKETYDYVVCSGVFEYIRNPAEFLKKNSKLARTMILSYNPFGQLPGDTKIRRLNCDWINHFTKPELEALFDKTGLEWKIFDVTARKNEEFIYVLNVRS